MSDRICYVCSKFNGLFPPTRIFVYDKWMCNDHKCPCDIPHKWVQYCENCADEFICAVCNYQREGKRVCMKCSFK